MSEITNRKHQIRWIISLVLLLAAYLLAAFWCGLSLSQKRMEDILPHSTATNTSCDYLTKYHVTKVPGHDTNMWLLDSYLELTFDSAILSDPICLGTLLSDMSSYMTAGHYNESVKLRFLDKHGKFVRVRFTLSP